MLSEWQQSRLSERLSSDNDIANASELQINKIRGLVYDVESLPLVDSVDHILDILGTENTNDPLLKRVAGMCLEVLCEEKVSLIED